MGQRDGHPTTKEVPAKAQQLLPELGKPGPAPEPPPKPRRRRWIHGLSRVWLIGTTLCGVVAGVALAAAHHPEGAGIVREVWKGALGGAIGGAILGLTLAFGRGPG